MPTLDVLRAFSIIPVVFLHTSSSEFATKYVGYLGSYGVLLFFCISGFLLSYLAFEEIKKNGYFHVRAFYMRRLLRIWPNYFLYIILINVFLLTNPDVTNWFLELFLSVFFLGNLLNSIHPFVEGVPHGSIYFNILWSLAVEEQFYLFFPVILALFTKNKFRTIIIACIGIAIVITGLRYYLIQLGLQLNYSKPYWPGIAFQTNTYFDIILFSVFLGYVKSTFKYKLSQKYTKMSLFSLVIIFVLLSFFFFRNLTYLEAKYSLGFIGMGIILGLITYLSSFMDINKKKIVSKIFISIGKQSYGIYLFHIPISLILSAVTYKVNIVVPFFTVWVFIISYMFSLFLYKYYEVHFRKIRTKHLPASTYALTKKSL